MYLFVCTCMLWSGSIVGLLYVNFLAYYRREHLDEDSDFEPGDKAVAILSR